MDGPACLSEIDKERFGIRVARANRTSVGEFRELLNFCESNKVDLLIARCDTNELRLAQKMESEGFFLTDTLIYYKFELGKKEIPEDSGVAILRPVRRGEDEPEVRKIAEGSFKGYFGHYHADARLDRKKCDEAYVSWATRSCTMRDVADAVIVAEHNGRMAGFATLRLNSKEEGEGVLFGVAPEAQGLGIYRSFMIHGMRWCQEQSARQMVVSTQITNLAVQKVWCRVGFEPNQSLYTFHKWFGSEGE